MGLSLIVVLHSSIRLMESSSEGLVELRPAEAAVLSPTY